MEKELTSKLIDAIIEFSGEELDRADLIALAKETNLELVERLISITEYYRDIENSSDSVWFARKCDATGVGMNAGYVYGEGDMYFSSEEHLIKHLRSLGDETYNDATDEFILKEAYENDEYYYTEWHDQQDMQYELVNGELKEIE
jgi:hypothetical protein